MNAYQDEPPTVEVEAAESRCPTLPCPPPSFEEIIFDLDSEEYDED